MILRLAVVLLGVLVAVLPAPVPSDTQAMFYLAKFGYLSASLGNRGSGTIISADAMVKAVSEFQSFAGLNITGEIDEETSYMMNLPRCGVKDKVGFASDARSKRYALQGSRWRVKDLTYRITKYPSKLDKPKVDKELAKAFSVWAGQTDLTFTAKSTGSVHIEVRFERGEHGDGDPFDGPGGTLAHAYFPVYGGDAHFDDQEAWTIDSYRGTNLFQVAAHEFGHSLGLSHSDVKSALMAPFYRGYEPHFELDQDDIQGIQALYGKKSTNTIERSSSTTSTTTERAVVAASDDDAGNELCLDGKIDTIFNSAEGVTYVFKGDKYWKLTDSGIASGYPRPIAKSWPGLPGNIDAAFTYRNGKTYFFKGDQYWRFVGKRVDGEYPKPISEGFTGIPDSVDAALVWSGNGKIYFFKGTKFWRFDPSQRPPVKSTYPKPLSNWENVPDHLDAALHYTNGYTYFFKGGTYYRFNDRTFAVDHADPAFPRSSGYWWFGCSSPDAGTSSGNSGPYSEGGVASERKDRAFSRADSDVDDIMLDAGEGGNPDAARDRRPVGGRSAGVRHGSSTVASLLVVVLAAVTSWRCYT